MCPFELTVLREYAYVSESIKPVVTVGACLILRLVGLTL